MGGAKTTNNQIYQPTDGHYHQYNGGLNDFHSYNLVSPEVDLGIQLDFEQNDYLQPYLRNVSNAVPEASQQQLNHRSGMTLCKACGRFENGSHYLAPLGSRPAGDFTLTIDERAYEVNDDGIPHLAFMNHQNAAYAYRYKVTKHPHVDPNSDITIAEVERDRELYISQLFQAMINLDGIHDTENSRERKLFRLGTPGAASGYKIEATCRAIFDALIDRCVNGFRGTIKENKTLKPEQGLEADRDCNCFTRMQYVLDALWASKCTCRDVLNEDSKIILLVNHPLHYQKTKRRNQLNNVTRARGIQEVRHHMDRNASARLAALQNVFPEEFHQDKTSIQESKKEHDLDGYTVPANAVARIHGLPDFPNHDVGDQGLVDQSEHPQFQVLRNNIQEDVGLIVSTPPDEVHQSSRWEQPQPLRYEPDIPRAGIEEMDQQNQAHTVVPQENLSAFPSTPAANYIDPNLGSFSRSQPTGPAPLYPQPWLPQYHTYAPHGYVLQTPQGTPNSRADLMPRTPGMYESDLPWNQATTFSGVAYRPAPAGYLVPSMSRAQSPMPQGAQNQPTNSRTFAKEGLLTPASKGIDSPPESPLVKPISKRELDEDSNNEELGSVSKRMKEN
ncbi:hypothetical protein K469DRAFT_693547 [Zopfia rhizophila CBS 207.26]|uniref:Uncharacterized protein n=1 Tax=Zopfia rhizophila CBS 207.26 TaxID=1314779 RepID=A0A6A6DLU5_9PEZI|nr:hypothetical protein K469DRAFT_693547 [Zopfia rhizophila CBS 207.26]